MAVTSVSNMENNQIIDMQFIISRASYEMYWKIKLTYYFYWKLFKNALESKKSPSFTRIFVRNWRIFSGRGLDFFVWNVECLLIQHDPVLEIIHIIYDPFKQIKRRSENASSLLS